MGGVRYTQSLKLLWLSKSPKKNIQFRTPPEDAELIIKVFTTGEQVMLIMCQSMKLIRLKKTS